MVIFAIGGAVAGVIGGGIIGAATYDDYSCHSDSGYDDYTYDDAASREIALLEKQKEAKRRDINTYKNDKIDSYIENQELKNKSAAKINDSEINQINREVMNSIDAMKSAEKDKKTDDLRTEIDALSSAINELEDVKKRMEAAKDGTSRNS